MTVYILNYDIGHGVFLGMGNLTKPLFNFSTQQIVFSVMKQCYLILLLFILVSSCESNEEKENITKPKISSNKKLSLQTDSVKISKPISEVKENKVVNKTMQEPVIDFNALLAWSQQNPFHYDFNYHYEDSMIKSGIRMDRIIGETYEYSIPSNGWRDDTSWQSHTFGPSSYEEYFNSSYSQKIKKAFYRYKDGLRINGYIKDSVEYNGIKELRFEGNFQNGLLQGKAIFYFTESDFLDIHFGDIVPIKNSIKGEGYFENGLFVGEWICYNRDGSIREKRKY